MDARAAERESGKRRRVEPDWKEPVRKLLFPYDASIARIKFKDNKYNYSIQFNKDNDHPTLTLIGVYAPPSEILEDKKVIDYCVALMAESDKWKSSFFEYVYYTDIIENAPFLLTKVDPIPVFYHKKEDKYTLLNRDASIDLFLVEHDLPKSVIIVLKLPNLSYYLCKDSTQSGIKTNKMFTQTTLYEKDVFWAMNKEGWVKTMLSVPPKIIYTIEHKIVPRVSQPPIIKSNPGIGYTYKLPKDVEKFVRECNCNDVLYMFMAYNGTLIDVRYRNEATQRKELEMTYDLHPGFLKYPFLKIRNQAIRDHGDHVFSLSIPLTDKQIQFITDILRLGFLCRVTNTFMRVYFSGPNEWKHYAYRYGYEVRED